jgi:hypothetical protein
MIAKLGPKDFWTILAVGASIFLAVILIKRQKSKFKPYRREYVRDTINTNPAKRQSGPFDGCSPEDFSACKTSTKQFEGRPLA